MKKLVYAVMLLLGLSIFGSCSKEGGSTGGASWLVGDWIEESTFGHADYYFSFSKAGTFAEHGGFFNNGSFAEDECWFENGTLYYTSNVEWDKELEMEYKIVDGNLFFAGFVYGTIKKINNDTMKIESDLDDDYYVGTYHRIKNFKVKDK